MRASLLEPRQPLAVRREHGRQYLDRDITAKLRVVRAIDLAHPARADERRDLVRANALPLEALRHEAVVERHRRRLQKARRLIVVRQQQLDFVAQAGVTPPTITGSIAALHVIYEVQVGELSFTALIQGGSTSLGGRLEGVIVSGWRTGARVRVACDTLSSCTDRDGVAHGPCFDGTIRVGRAPEK